VLSFEDEGSRHAAVLVDEEEDGKFYYRCNGYPYEVFMNENILKSKKKIDFCKVVYKREKSRLIFIVRY
jgi:hypothetical protein